MALGKRLRKLRKERRLSIKEVADQIGVAASTYREWEEGRKILGEPYLKIAKALDVSVGQLLLLPEGDRTIVLRELEIIKNSLSKLEKELCIVFVNESQLNI